MIKQVWVCGVDGVVPLRCFLSVCKLSMGVNYNSNELSHGLHRLMVAHDVTSTYCLCMWFVKCFSCSLVGGLVEHAAVMVLRSHRKWRGEGEEERKEKREDKGVGKSWKMLR